jgi:four helix bundle protein
MATIKCFEDIEAWQLARVLENNIFQLSNVGGFARDFDLKNQINSATGSVMDNIAEGFERGGRKEFLNFLSTAKGSAGEVRSQLYRAFDRKYIQQKDFEENISIAKEVSGKIGSLMQYLNQSEIQGLKFKDRK